MSMDHYSMDHYLETCQYSWEEAGSIRCRTPGKGKPDCALLKIQKIQVCPLFCPNLQDLTKGRHGYERKLERDSHRSSQTNAENFVQTRNSQKGVREIMSFPVSPHFPRTFIYNTFFFTYLYYLLISIPKPKFFIYSSLLHLFPISCQWPGE